MELKSIFLNLFIILNLLVQPGFINADDKIKCFGKKQKRELVPGGFVENFINFEISSTNGFLNVYGAGLPYTGFKITTSTDEKLISKVVDKEGYTWFIIFNRYSGEFYLDRTQESDFSQYPLFDFIISDSFCKKKERIL